MQSIEEILKEKQDVKGGIISYAQYISLKNALAEEKEEVQLMQDILEALHGEVEIKPKDYLNENLQLYIKEIAEGLNFWAEQEKEKLNIEPTPEQIRAGVKEYSEKVGVSGTIYALARQFKIDPDVILQWQWAKVFGILYADVEQYKYTERFNKIINSKG